jgi:hypothetical protein
LLGLWGCQSGKAGLSGVSGTSDGSYPSGGDSDEAPPDTGEPVAECIYRVHSELQSLVYVSWEQLADARVWVEYSFDEGEWHSSPPFDATAGPQEQLLLGIPYDTAVTWRIVSRSGELSTLGEDCSGLTGPLPEGAPTAVVTVSEPARWDATGRFLYLAVGQFEQMWRLIIDRQGRPVWAQPNAENIGTFTVRESYSGEDLLFDQVDYFSDSAEVVRARIDGSVVDRYDTPGLHHAYTELDDGSLVWGVYLLDGELRTTLERRWPDGSQETIWDVDDFVGADEDGGGSDSRINAIDWDEGSDTFLISFPYLAIVARLEASTGELLEHWGGESDWGFEPAESEWIMPHGVTRLDNGNILLSATRSGDSESALGVVREYSLDDEVQVLNEVWSLGTEEEIRIGYYGEAHRLPGGNTLQNLGGNPRVREATPDGEIVWDLHFLEADGSDSELLTRSILLEDLYAFAP